MRDIALQRIEFCVTCTLHHIASHCTMLCTLHVAHWRSHTNVLTTFFSSPYRTFPAKLHQDTSRLGVHNKLRATWSTCRFTTPFRAHCATPPAVSRALQVRSTATTPGWIGRIIQPTAVNTAWQGWWWFPSSNQHLDSVSRRGCCWVGRCKLVQISNQLFGYVWLHDAICRDWFSH